LVSEENRDKRYGLSKMSQTQRGVGEKSRYALVESIYKKKGGR